MFSSRIREPEKQVRIFSFRLKLLQNGPFNLKACLLILFHHVYKLATCCVNMSQDFYIRAKSVRD